MTAWSTQLNSVADTAISAADFAGGRPLDPRTRALMEARLGHNFGAVRVHTGARPAMLARRLGARAFALGADIFFAPRQYTPSTPAGLSLLAHELVHVAQQGARRCVPGWYAVGGVDDRCEREADAAVAALFGGDRAPVITESSPPVIRRVVALPVPATLTVTLPGTTACAVTNTGANAIGAPTVQWHLTTGFNAKAPGNSGAAWTVNGSVPLFISAKDNTELAQNQAALAKWKIGFMQYMRLNTHSRVFAGINTNDGGVLVDAAKTPAWTAASLLLLDSAVNVDPWTFAPTSGTSAAGALTVGTKLATATATTIDHPGGGTTCRAVNSQTGRDNYLLKLIDDRDFWTLFIAEDAKKNQTVLAHFHGKVRWEFQFVYKNKQPVATLVSGSGLTLDTPQLGSPISPSELTTLMKAPAAPFFNDVSITASQTAIFYSGQPCRTDTKTRFGLIPANFWT